MKKAILSLAMLIIAICTYGQDASYLIKQYKKVKGAKYENMTKQVKKTAKKEKYINPEFYELSCKIKNTEVVTVNLSEDEREALTTNIEGIEGFKSLYQKKSNATNMLSDNWSLFKESQYFGIEENGIIKDAIIRIDATSQNDIITVIIHIEGELTPEEVMKAVQLDERKSIKYED